MIGAAVVALVAGCGSSGGPGQSAGPAGRAAKTSAHQAVVMAAESSHKIKSATATMNVQIGSTSETTGSMKLSMKPTLQMSAAMKVTAAGKTLPMVEVLTSDALYFKVPGLQQATGKAWMKVSLSQLSGKTGVQFRQLLQDVSNGDPMKQTEMLAAAENIRSEGSQTVNGVPCTKYAGSYTAAQVKAALTPAERKALGPGLSKLSGTTHFTTWIDAQHHVRKLVTTQSVAGQPVTQTIIITSINQPVSVQAPPASQVAPMPKNLGTGSSGL